MITKAAVDINTYSKDICFSDAARDCWKAILMNFEHEPKILLPSYVGITDREGSGIFDPVTELKLTYGFYPLNLDLTVDINNLSIILESNTFDVILLVHYFGLKIQNIDKVVSMCRQNKIIVIEDCAHLFNIHQYNLSDAGTFGDYAFYSLHKYFPFDAGGMLVKNTDTLSMPKIEKAATREWGTELMKYDVQSISTKRINNFRVYERLLPNLNGVRPLRKFAKGDLPHNYPIIIENDLREPLYFWLMENDIPLIALYYRLIDPILSDSKFDEMQWLSKSILNLPVHQDIEVDDIKRILLFLEKGLKELNK